MEQAEFLERWNRERDMYRVWGEFVQREIEAELLRNENSVAIDVFLKIPAAPRLKSDDSLLNKAFYRRKTYADPYVQIEDKVGVRFVVLLTTDIGRIQDIIEHSPSWAWSLDRDFETDRDERPYEFAYQSKHYVLRAALDITVDGVAVAKDTPCEVQLRTLLQHAHSELTHDNIYKRDSKSSVTTKIERTVAKSMALIEAVDDYFVSAMSELEAATDVERSALAALMDVYIQQTGRAPQTDKSTALVLDAFREEITARSAKDRVAVLLATHAFVTDRIRERAERLYVFRQPWIYLVYALVESAPNQAARKWPLTPDELRPIYMDLAKHFPL